MDYMSRKKIMHWDLKPDNILIKTMIEENYEIKIADFGLSV